MMKSSKEMAEIWNVSERTVTTFCKSGKVHGAIKEGRTWKIPEDAKYWLVSVKEKRITIRETL